MIKNVTLISVAITTVVLVIVAGVVYAYQGFMTPKTVSTPPASSDAVSFPLMVSAPTDVPTNVPNVSPQDAASLAAKFSNRTDVYTVEIADFGGTQSYKVTFGSGDTVYIAMNGQVIGAVQAPPAPPPPLVISSDPPKSHGGRNKGGSSGGSGSGGGGDGGGDD